MAKPQMRRCDECRKPYRPKTVRSKYHADSCRQRAYVRRRNEQEEHRAMIRAAYRRIREEARQRQRAAAREPKPTPAPQPTPAPTPTSTSRTRPTAPPPTGHEVVTIRNVPDRFPGRPLPRRRAYW